MNKEEREKEKQLWYPSNVLIFSLKLENKHFMTCQIFLNFVTLPVLKINLSLLGRKRKFFFNSFNTWVKLCMVINEYQPSFIEYFIRSKNAWPTILEEHMDFLCVAYNTRLTSKTCFSFSYTIMRIVLSDLSVFSSGKNRHFKGFLKQSSRSKQN